MRAAREGDEDAAAARIRASAIRDQLVAALDEWAMLSTDPPRTRWLLGVARRVDPDAWRNRFRDPQGWRDRAHLQRLANELLTDEKVTRMGRLRSISRAESRPYPRAVAR